MKLRKKFFNSLMAVAFTALSFGLTACGDDDDEPKVEDKFTTEYTFEAEFTPDLLKTANVTAYILSPDGVVTEETVTKEKASWTLKGNSIPDKAGVRFDFDAKAGDFAGDYEIGCKVKATVSCLNNGDVDNFKSLQPGEIYTVAAENLAEFYGTSFIIGGEVNANGVASVTDGSGLNFGINASISRPPFMTDVIR